MGEPQHRISSALTMTSALGFSGPSRSVKDEFCAGGRCDVGSQGAGGRKRPGGRLPGRQAGGDLGGDGCGIGHRVPGAQPPFPGSVVPLDPGMTPGVIARTRAGLGLMLAIRRVAKRRTAPSVMAAPTTGIIARAIAAVGTPLDDATTVGAPLMSQAACRSPRGALPAATVSPSGSAICLTPAPRRAFVRRLFS